MPQYLIFAFFLEAVMAKFKKVTKNDLWKYLTDQLKYAPDRIDGGGRKSLKEIDSEAHQHNREFTPIEEVHLWIKTLHSVFLCTWHVHAQSAMV